MIDYKKPPLGLRHVVRWSESSLEPKGYWGDRYEDALYERVDGFLSGFLIGFVIGTFLTIILIGVIF